MPCVAETEDEIAYAGGIRTVTYLGKYFKSSRDNSKLLGAPCRSSKLEYK